MPRKIDGKRLTAREDRMWKHVFEATGSGAQATAAVKRDRTRRARKRSRK